MQFSGELVIAATAERVSGLTAGPVHQRNSTADKNKTTAVVVFVSRYN